MLGAGQRNHRVRFEKRIEVNPDAPLDLGNVESRFAPLVECWAGFRPKFGREQIAAGALESSLTGVLTVLRFGETAAADAQCRVVFLAGPYAGQICQIRSIVPTPDNREIEFLLEAGPAT